MENNKIKVENRSNKYLVDTLPNTNIRFIWDKQGSFVFLTKEQILEMYYKPGGQLFFENLIIHDKALCKELMGEVEPEYFYTAEDIDKILLKGSLDQLKDTIDFGPEGVVDLVVARAIKLAIPDYNKRAAILEMTGHNISVGIELSKGIKDTENVASVTKRRRRVSTNINVPD